MAVTVKSTTEDGTQVEVTIDKTGADKGTIQVKKWKKGKDPKKDAPDEDETTDLYDIKTKKDGSRTVCKADVSFSDPDVTITVNCPDPPKNPGEPKKKPSITVTVKGTTAGAGDGTTTYEISEADQTAILDFLKAARFPALALASSVTGGALAVLIRRPDHFSAGTLDRIALTLNDVAESIRRREDDWVEVETGLSFVGFDPGLQVGLVLEGPEFNPSLVLSIRTSARVLGDPANRFRDAFVHPSRPERVDEMGNLLKESSAQTRKRPKRDVRKK